MSPRKISKTEELNFSVIVTENGRHPTYDAIPFKDRTSERCMEKNQQGLEIMGNRLSIVTKSGRDSDGCKDLRRYSMLMEQALRPPSSQLKGAVPQPNGRWGAQIYEKVRRVWLGTFNREEDAAWAYDRAALKVRGQDAMTNFSLVGGSNPEAQFNTILPSGGFH